MFKSKANFWYKVWKQAGSPSSGTLFQIKRSSKSRYKYEVRRLKRRKEYIRRQKMAEALAGSNLNKFWRQVRDVTRKSRSPAIPSVDGVHGPANISQHFASKIQLTLNSENSD